MIVVFLLTGQMHCITLNAKNNILMYTSIDMFYTTVYTEMKKSNGTACYVYNHTRAQYSRGKETILCYNHGDMKASTAACIKT